MLPSGRSSRLTLSVGRDVPSYASPHRATKAVSQGDVGRHSWPCAEGRKERLRGSWQQYRRQNIRVSDASERLRRRYPKSRVPRPLLVGVIGVVVVIALTWLVWTALRHAQPIAVAQVQAFRVTSDTSVSVTMSVQRRDPSVPVTCRVLAQAADHQPVGEQQVAVAASRDQFVDVNLVMTTLRRATAVVIKGCTVA